ncbi:MAG: hypothetical protein NTW79_01575 [Candidatus Berkelbacteria bacterium]|nr:hypothetical protein [Candidatus Berkelbacteria bacterium]
MKNSKKNLIQVVVIASVIFLFAGKSFASEITPENIIIDVNIERAIYNIQLLNVNDQLTVAAENKSADMLSRSYFEHYAFGLSPWAFIISKNYQYQSAGENLARGMLG